MPTPPPTISQAPISADGCLLPKAASTSFMCSLSDPGCGSDCSVLCLGSQLTQTISALARPGRPLPAAQSHGPSIAPLSLKSTTSRLRVSLESTLAGPRFHIAQTPQVEILALPLDMWCGTPILIGFARFEIAPVVSLRCKLANDFPRVD